ncbi:MAG: hypothetical protein H6R18_964 [Proteobacteria bacterium]|nr:hypothetical protein [Pseudomonadota bacterium]
MDQLQLTAGIEAAIRTEDGRKQLSCARAHVLAEDFGVTLAEIGRYCQSQDIKIIDCQLGCFGSVKKHA